MVTRISGRPDSTRQVFVFNTGYFFNERGNGGVFWTKTETRATTIQDRMCILFISDAAACVNGRGCDRVFR